MTASTSSPPPGSEEQVLCAPAPEHTTGGESSRRHLSPKAVAVAVLLLSVGIVPAVVLMHGGGRTRPRGTASAPVAKAQLAHICERALGQIAALPRPATNDPASPQSIAFAGRVLQIEDQSLAQAQAIVRSEPSVLALAPAFAIEDRGQKLVAKEIPDLRQGNVTRAEQYAAAARQLTSPADAAIRSAGLGVCVGS